jgi:hypothetical protein
VQAIPTLKLNSKYTNKNEHKMPVLRVQATPPLASGISRTDLAEEILADILAEVETGLAAQLDALYNTVMQTQNTLRGKAEEIAGLHDRISKLETGLSSKDGELLREKERLESDKKAAVQTAKDLARAGLEALKEMGLEALKQMEEKTKGLEQTHKELQDNNIQLQEEKKRAQAELGSVREVLKQGQEDLVACKRLLEHCNARAASQDPSDPDVAPMTVKLSINFKAAGDEGSLQRSKFEKDLVSDLATASGVAADRFKIRKLAPGSVLVGVDIYPEPSGHGPSAAEVSEELEKQADDPSSALRRGKVTSSVSDIALPHQQLLEHEELKRLRATSKKQLAKELADKGAQQQSEERTQLDELEHTTRDLERQLAASEARRLQLERTMCDLERQLAASQHQVAHLSETKTHHAHAIAQLEGELAATKEELQQEVGKNIDASADNETVVPVRQREARKALRSAPPLPVSLKEQQEMEGAGKRDAEACAEKLQVLKLSQLSLVLENAKQRHVQDDTVKRLSQVPDAEARTSDLESALVVLEAEHQPRAAALEARLAELGGALALQQENPKASAGASSFVQTSHRRSLPTMGALPEGQDELGKMKAISEKAEHHLKEKAGQYSEREKPLAGQKLVNRSPFSDRPESQEGTRNPANTSELSEAAYNALASSDGGKHCPVAVGLTLDVNFDHVNRSAASVSDCVSDFNRELQEIVSASLKVPAATVLVLCHQRGCIKATVVLIGDDDDQHTRTPSELAQELINVVGPQGEGLRTRSLLGSYVKKAQVLGPIALPICKAVQDAVATSQAMRLSASVSSAREVAAAGNGQAESMVEETRERFACEKEQLTSLARLRAEEEQQEIGMYKMALHTQCASRIKKMQADLKINANLFSGGLEGLANELTDIHTRFILEKEDAAERAKSNQHAMEDLRNKLHYATQHAFTVKQQMTQLRDQYEQQLMGLQATSHKAQERPQPQLEDRKGGEDSDASADNAPLHALPFEMPPLDVLSLLPVASPDPAVHARAHAMTGDNECTIQRAASKAKIIAQLQPLLDGLTWDEAAPLLAKMDNDFLQTALTTGNVQPVLTKLKAAEYHRPEMRKLQQAAAESQVVAASCCSKLQQADAESQLQNLLLAQVACGNSRAAEARTVPASAAPASPTGEVSETKSAAATVENVQGACRDGQLVREEEGKSLLPGGEDSDESADNESVAPMRRKTRRTLRSAAPLLLPPPVFTDQEDIPAIKREERGVCTAFPPVPADSAPVGQSLVEGVAGVRAAAGGGEEFSVSHKTPSAPHRGGGRKAYTWGQPGWAPILAFDTDDQDFEIIPAHSPSESVNHHGASDAMCAWSPSPSAQHAETVQASGVLEPVSLGSTPPSSPAGNIKKPSPTKPQLGLDFTSWFGAFGAVVQVPEKTPNSLSSLSRAAASAPQSRAISQTSDKNARKVTLRASQLLPAISAPAASTRIPGQLFLDGEELTVQDPALDMLNCLCERTVPYRVVMRNGEVVCQPAESATGFCHWVCVDCGQVHGAATVPTPIDLSSVSPTP